MQNSSSTLLKYRVGCSYDTTIIHFPPSLFPSLYPCLPPYCTDPFHMSPPCTLSAWRFHATSCINTTTLPLPLQFLSILVPLNFLRLLMYFLIPSLMLLPTRQFLHSSYAIIVLLPLHDSLNSQFVFNADSIFLLFTFN